MSRDRRDSYRFEVGEGEVRLCLSPGRPEARVLDLSASGGSIVSPAGLIEEMTSGPVVLHAGGYPPFTLKIATMRSVEEAGLARVGVRFGQLDRRALRSLSRFLIDRFQEQSTGISRLVDEAEFSIGNFQRNLVCRLLLFHAISRGRRMRVYRGNLLLPLVLRVREMIVEAARQLIVAEVLAGTAAMLRRGQEYTFAFSGANAVNYFKTEVWRNESGRVLVMLPPDIRQAGFRESFRTRLPEEPPLKVFFKHPRLPGLQMAKRVLDVSAQGFSFPLDLEQDMLCPGERIGQVFLDLPEGPVRVEAAVRGIVHTDECGGLACGAEILGFSKGREAERWRRFVFHAGHARLRLGKRALVKDAWKVLESSGYVALTNEFKRLHLKSSFLASWERHARKSKVSRFFLLLKGDRPVGTAAASLLYPGTWMAHHFGIDEKERKEDKRKLFDFSREIYSGIMFLLGHMASLEYFVFYFDSIKTFHERAFGQFLKRYPAKEEFLYDRFKLFSCIPRVNQPEPRAVRGRPDIVSGDRRLLNLLSRHLRAHRPPIEFEAFRYAEEEIALEGFSRACAAKGYERERHIFFARDGDEPLAALIAETGDEGLNIFSLFNKCWFVYMKPEAARDDQVKDQLLRKAIRYYGSKGKKSFLLVGSWGGEPEGLLEGLGFSYVADGLRWLGRRAIIPAYMNYIEELMGMAKTHGY